MTVTVDRSVEDFVATPRQMFIDGQWVDAASGQTFETRLVADASLARRPMERVIVTIDTQGNTSAASVPLALDTGIRDGRVKRGQLLLLEAFGGGFTWGSALIRY